MFYVIENFYAGPDGDQNLNEDTIEISTEPARTNLSNEIRINGWCGTTNDWGVNAHGEYATIDEARAAIKSIFGVVRERDNDGLDDSIVELYEPGSYTELNAEETENYFYYAFKADIDSDTTDEQLAALESEYETLANEEGYTLSDELENQMIEYRQKLRDEESE